MTGNFIPCCNFTLTQEGGFCDVAGDPGGATNHGITMYTLSAYLGRQATIDDVRNLTAETAEAIYKPDYWDALHADLLPLGLDLLAFDFGVNAGPKRSAMILQKLVGTVADGDIGPATARAIGQHSTDWLIASLTVAHIQYYRTLDGFAEFGDGWIARANRAQVAGYVMAG